MINRTGLTSTPKPGKTPRPAGGLNYKALKEALIVSSDPTLRREARAAFNRLSFADQLPLIAEHTREQLAAADTYIKLNWHGDGAPAPSANNVWRILREKRCGVNNGAMIGRLFPSLSIRSSAEQSRGQDHLLPPAAVGRYLAGLYRFWVEKLYAFDWDGLVSVASIFASPARFLTHEQIRAIDSKAELLGLGANLTGYANFLAENSGELVIR